MNNRNLNPFKPTRWEHHSDGMPLIWFTDTANDLVGEKSVFVYGSRGSGKTTLLKGICWEDLAFNASLRIQKQVSDFSHLGIYIRFPDHISASFSEKALVDTFDSAPEPELEFHRFFSLLIECVCIERLLETFHELRILGELSYTPKQELTLVDDLIKEHSKLTNYASGDLTTFVDLARCFRSLVRNVNQAFSRGQLKAIADDLPPREPYELLAFVTQRLSGIGHLRSQLGEHNPSFKFCFDDCEVLNKIQRKSLNSLVRQSRTPVSWVIASVGKSQWASETFLNSQPLTDADRSIISLDRRPKEDFKSLCEAVVSMRLLFSLPDHDRPTLGADELKSFFSLDLRLGAMDVNGMIAKLIAKSNRPIAKQLECAASALQDAQIKANPKRKLPPNLPYYETYILLHWRGGERSFKTSFGEEDIARLPEMAELLVEAKFGGWLRRKQVNALLQLSNKLGVKRIPLSGARNITTLADGSIRDFLEVMGEIFDEFVAHHKWEVNAKDNLTRFAASRSKISDSIQTRGIYNASESYLNGISSRSDIDGDLVTRLVNGLGYLTSFLQSNPTDPRVLAFAERGIFIIQPEIVPERNSMDIKDTLSTLRQAELAGYLRPVETNRIPRRISSRADDTLLAYRLHRRFSPHFRFSFRGAYEPFKLEFQELMDLCLDAEKGSAFAWAKTMAGISERFGDPQIQLPFEESVSDE